MFTSLAAGAIGTAASLGATAAGTGTILGMSAATLSNIALVSGAVSAASGVAGSIMQANQQSKQAKYQADIAQRNADLAEQSASAERREGYENMISQRQQAAKLIGKQRAIQGASGTAVDTGSNLDVNLDTAERGEIDALKAMQQGYNRAYNYELQATNYRNESRGYLAQASEAKKQGYINAASQAAQGIANMGTTWAKFNSGLGAGTSGTSGVYDAFLGKNVATAPKSWSATAGFRGR